MNPDQMHVADYRSNYKNPPSAIEILLVGEASWKEINCGGKGFPSSSSRKYWKRDVLQRINRSL